MHKNKSSTKFQQELREKHNKDLIRRMRNGEPLTRFDNQDSWFPPRPIIEKDPKAIARLYGLQEQAQDIEDTESQSDLRVVKLH